MLLNALYHKHVLHFCLVVRECAVLEMKRQTRILPKSLRLLAIRAHVWKRERERIHVTWYGEKEVGMVKTSPNDCCSIVEIYQPINAWLVHLLSTNIQVCCCFCCCLCAAYNYIFQQCSFFSLRSRTHFYHYLPKRERKTETMKREKMKNHLRNYVLDLF